ncbi:MAG: glycerate kinase [Methylococcaceae bacterium]|jgi:hydroxypyruvate reductase
MGFSSTYTNTGRFSATRQHALQIFQAGVIAADPYLAVKRNLWLEDDKLKILHDQLIRHGTWPKIHLLAFGKAACAMAQAAQETIPHALWASKGIAVTNYENVCPIEGFDVIGAAHPLPDQAGLNAAKRIAEQAMNAQAGELVLVMVSGGGSALIPYPAGQISLSEKSSTTDLLLASGATINQINCVRKHLSRLKGGGLARFAAPADLHALILSDVLNDDLSAIASGPTVPDPTTYADAIDILKTLCIWQLLPETIRQHLQLGLNGQIADTPKRDDPIFSNTGYTLIGSNSISLDAITQAAKKHGYDTIRYSDNLSGEARTAATNLALYSQQLSQQGFNKPIAILAGGETTVTVKGKGLGGRNQEFALAFACAAKELGLTANWTFLSGGTDGRDGPTDAAGGLVDVDSLQRMQSAGIIALNLLNDNNAYTALKSSNDLLMTGATGTNVADLQILLLQPNP